MNMSHRSSALRLEPFASEPSRTPASKPCACRGAFLLMIVPFLLMVGCVSTPAAGPRPAEAPGKKAPDPFAALQPGMTAEEVRSLVGEPKEIKPLKTASLKSEVWLYDRKIADLTRTADVGNAEVPVVNPFTGVASTTKDTIMNLREENITVYEAVEVLMIDGHFAALKRKQWSEQKYY